MSAILSMPSVVHTILVGMIASAEEREESRIKRSLLPWDSSTEVGAMWSASHEMPSEPSHWPFSKPSLRWASRMLRFPCEATYEHVKRDTPFQVHLRIRSSASMAADFSNMFFLHFLFLETFST